ncbi:hypothetical protein [Roseicyclus marinus]|uniref:hypothetical protein n=1 Tax=Roseicyclus marinus TaxID=2161673 RepID=UPI00240E9D5E|nr:hypothetical protein [Roseicyclus marinus]MDG3040454.1 hypothetical protein [Roseicyclus marinus]
MSEAPSISGIRWPLLRGETLSNYDWHPFHHHRFMESEFLAEILLTGQRAQGFTAMLLWSVSINQDPAGTLPMSDRHLAVLARCASLAEWEEMRDIALRGWVTVKVEDPQTGVDFERLGHPMTLAIVTEMIERKRSNKAKQTAGKDRQKMVRIRKKMMGLKVGREILENPMVMNRLVRHFNLTGLHVTDENVKQILVEEFGFDSGVRPFGGANSFTRTTS